MSEPFARPGTPLCVVTLTYDAPLDVLDAAMKDHVGWLTKGYEAGLFVVSGRRSPRTGGIILIRGHQADVEALIATDPFVERKLAHADVVEFHAGMAAPALADLLA
ncbi:MAG TPA: YciI family protein [Sphingomonas sp.]|nr:YciI family protein [Sphingomonas sp.]